MLFNYFLDNKRTTFTEPKFQCKARHQRPLKIRFQTPSASDVTGPTVEATTKRIGKAEGDWNTLDSQTLEHLNGKSKGCWKLKGFFCHKVFSFNFNLRRVGGGGGGSGGHSMDFYTGRRRPEVEPLNRFT